MLVLGKILRDRSPIKQFNLHFPNHYVFPPLPTPLHVLQAYFARKTNLKLQSNSYNNLTDRKVFTEIEKLRSQQIRLAGIQVEHFKQDRAVLGLSCWML